ncbi:MAG: hypothetical protein M0001_03635 [Treponema sp.]|nr:hypothetical protein [Treponema sp.]
MKVELTIPSGPLASRMLARQPIEQWLVAARQADGTLTAIDNGSPVPEHEAAYLENDPTKLLVVLSEAGAQSAPEKPVAQKTEPIVRRRN